MPEKSSYWSRIKGTMRTRVVSGLLVMIPLVVTMLILKLILGTMANILAPVIRATLEYKGMREVIDPAWEPYLVGVASIVALLILIYFIGVLAAYVFGRKVIVRGEGILLRLPLIKSIYAASKQVVEAVSLPNRSAFKAVVLVEFPRPGFLAMGFSTGTVEVNDRTYCRVFVPTAPNPTSGFFEIVEIDQVQETTLTVEEGFKIIVSGGILTPDALHTHPLSRESTAGPAGSIKLHAK